MMFSNLDRELKIKLAIAAVLWIMVFIAIIVRG